MALRARLGAELLAVQELVMVDAEVTLKYQAAGKAGYVSPARRKAC